MSVGDDACHQRIRKNPVIAECGWVDFSAHAGVVHLDAFRALVEAGAPSAREEELVNEHWPRRWSELHTRDGDTTWPVASRADTCKVVHRLVDYRCLP